MSILRQLWRSPKRAYRARGFAVLRDALSTKTIDEAAALARSVAMFEGEHLRQSGRIEANDFFPNTSLIRNPLFNVHLSLTPELRPLSSAIQTIITAPTLAERLDELDGGCDHYHINQTLLFFAAQTTDLHIDSWALDTVPHGGAHTLWIPLQDIDHRSGVPSVVPWTIGKVLTENDLGLPPSASDAERYERYHQVLSARILSERPEFTTALVHRGDVLVWSSLTPHLTMPSYPFPTERLSIQVLLRPAHLRWGNFTVQPDDYPMTRIVKATDRFSFFVSEGIHRDFGIGESYRPGAR